MLLLLFPRIILKTSQSVNQRNPATLDTRGLINWVTNSNLKGLVG